MTFAEAAEELVVAFVEAPSAVAVWVVDAGESVEVGVVEVDEEAEPFEDELAVAALEFVLDLGGSLAEVEVLVFW